MLAPYKLYYRTCFCPFRSEVSSPLRGSAGGRAAASGASPRRGAAPSARQRPTADGTAAAWLSDKIGQLASARKLEAQAAALQRRREALLAEKSEVDEERALLELRSERCVGGDVLL